MSRVDAANDNGGQGPKKHKSTHDGGESPARVNPNEEVDSMRSMQKNTPKKRPREPWTPKTKVALVAAVAAVLQGLAAILDAIT